MTNTLVTIASHPANLFLIVLDNGIYEVTGGQPTAFGVISPTDIADQHGVSVEDLLAGEFLFHFGGFLDERLRAHDFAVGYDAATRWLRNAVTPGGPLDCAGGAEGWLTVVEQRQPAWSLPAPVAAGSTRWQAVGLGLRAALLAGRDLVAWRPWRRH